MKKKKMNASFEYRAVSRLLLFSVSMGIKSIPNKALVKQVITGFEKKKYTRLKIGFVVYMYKKRREKRFI